MFSRPWGFSTLTSPSFKKDLCEIDRSHNSISKNTLYYEVFKILYLKFKCVLFQKQNFKFNFKIICILYYGLFICHN